MKYLNFATLFVLIVSAPLSILADESTAGFGNLAEDSDAPIEAIADEMIVNNEKSEAELTGNVVIIQGSTRLNADFVTLIYSESGSEVEEMFARGNVFLLSGEDEATSETADYNLARGTLIMTGDAVVMQDGNTVRSDRAEFDIETGAAVMTGRVRSVLLPPADE